VKASLSGWFSLLSTAGVARNRTALYLGVLLSDTVNAATVDPVTAGGTAVDSLLLQGPPWTRASEEPDRLLLLTVVIMGVILLLLAVAVLFLWSRQLGTARTGRDHTDTEQQSEFDRIKQIDATVSGELPQQEIVEQTDWSEAKVSRVVSRLAEEGRLEKVRIGRQNFIRVGESGDGDGESETTDPV
jgi:uncharacterized membrane protein